MGAVIALVGRLVDIAASLSLFSDPVTVEEQNRLRTLCNNIAGICEDLREHKPPHLVEPYPDELPGAATPLLREMEQTVSLIVEVYTGSADLGPFAPPTLPAEPQPVRLFAPDAFTNPEHIRFGLRGGLAASLAYLAYNLMGWPGISTAVTTCLLTALTTIGSSRQKQILRIGGALFGGAVAICTQVFVLPAIDSIAGFVVLFLVVSIPAAWIATSGPRLSYFGVQFAVAFYLVNLGEFRFQTSLAVARDRVAGILLGLFIMWAVFDQLWGSSAATAMKQTFISTLRLVAQLFREPTSSDLRAAIERSYVLRETIAANLDRLRQHADAVVLEFGPDRQHNLRLRDRLIQWQIRLRTIFVIRIALLKYRLQLPGFELPPPMQTAQRQFDRNVAATLERIADELESEARIQHDVPESPVNQPERTAMDLWLNATNPSAAAPRTFLRLTRLVHVLMQGIEREIG